MTRVSHCARACAIVLAAALPLGAQDTRPTAPSPADSALAEGRIANAEQLFFAASSAAPRDPAARGALGKFMAARGRLKVGAVLLGEARQFGGDRSAIEPLLGRIYAWLGDWTSTAGLKQYAATGPVHERALWLAAHAPSRGGADTASVALEPNEMAGLGRITLVIGGDSVPADIDPAVDGLVLPATPAISEESKQFGMREKASVAVVYTVGIGAIHLKNVAATLSPGVPATIGLDVLAPLTPTFDAGARVLSLRMNPVQAQGNALPFLLEFPGVRFVARPGEPLVAMESPAGRAALRGSRWTFDLRRGAIVVAP